jgi:beta-amylase
MADSPTSNSNSGATTPVSNESGGETPSSSRSGSPASIVRGWWPSGRHLYVLMPLDMVDPNNPSRIDQDPKKLKTQLETLKGLGADGVCIDIWWGIVQHDDLDKYNWKPYRDFFTLCREVNLLICPIMSFHACGTNVNDDVHIPLPKKVLELARSYAKKPFYKDAYGFINEEYLSLGADNEPIFEGKTPLKLYGNFMRDFVKEFLDFADVITSVEIGLGPCGEIRYPSYPKPHEIWIFPGVGAFQCYDPYMLEMMNKRFRIDDKHENKVERFVDILQQIGVGMIKGYTVYPIHTTLFNPRPDKPDDRLYLKEPYVSFFKWYSDCLVEHGERILKDAVIAFHPMNVKIVAKIAGVHWHYREGHAAEIATGYVNFMPIHEISNPSLERESFVSAIKSSFYYKFAEMCSGLGVEYNYTCFELAAKDMESQANSSPELLFDQISYSTQLANVRLRGENAFKMKEEAPHDRIIAKCRKVARNLTVFSYLRFGKSLKTKGVQDLFRQFATEFHKVHE